MKTVLRAILLVLLSAALGIALLVGVYALPKTAMRRNVALSAEVFSYESGYPRLIEGWHVSMLDNYTDVVMLLTAVGGQANESLLTLAANAPRPLYTTGSWLIDSIDAYVAAGMPENTPQVIYPRYWHGYLTVLKPMLLVLDYPQIRICNMLAQGFLLLAVMLLLHRRAGTYYAVALTAAVLCLTPIAIPLSLQFSTCFYITLFALLFLLLKYEWLKKKDYGALFFCALGIITNYFDFLTYPLVTLGLPLTVYLLLKKDATVKSSITAAVACGALWAFGYAAMWALKWAFATLITGNNVFLDAAASIGERTSLMGGGELGAGEITRFSTIGALIAMLKRRPYLLMAAGMMIGMLWLVIRKRATIGLTRLSVHAPSLLGIALLPLLWYAVMPNHSYTHYFYTFRSLSVTVFALLSCLFTFMCPRPANASEGHSSTGSENT